MSVCQQRRPCSSNSRSEFWDRLLYASAAQCSHLISLSLLSVFSLCCQIFYQVCSGVTSAERQNYRLEKAEYYYYLSCSNCYEVAGINDVADWKEMNDSFAVVGISEQERQEVIRAISVCLWLGNLAFCERKSEVAEVQDRQVLDIVAGLLQVPAQSLEQALCNRQIQTGVGAKGQTIKNKQKSKATAKNTHRGQWNA